VWGDEATEDFYFYPDGFGTRVLSLKRDPATEYELSEFIILAPQADFPFSFLPSNIVDMLFVDGTKREISFAYPEDDKDKREWPAEMAEKVQGTPIIYRVRLHKDERAAAIYFNPVDTHLPPVIYAPFLDRGEMVTPVYWAVIGRSPVESPLDGPSTIASITALLTTVSSPGPIADRPRSAGPTSSHSTLWVTPGS